MKKQSQTLSSYSPQFFKVQVLQPTTIEHLIATSESGVLTPKFRKSYKKELSIIIFVIKVNHEDRQWKLFKRLTDLLQFQHDLKKNYKREIPAIPIRKESEIEVKDFPSLIEFFDIFIKKVINVAFNDPLFHDFFNFFPSKFGNGIILSEVQLKKHSGGRYTEATCAKKFSNTFCRNWRNRWFTVTDEGIFYSLKRKSFQIKEMLNFSNHFKIFCGADQTGHQLGIEIKCSYRMLQLRAHSLVGFAIFVYTLKKSYEVSPHKDLHRYESFSSIKQHCNTQFYVDGENYFSAVKKQLLNAKKYVYITDWMMTPYFQLQRPAQLSDREARLDYVLETIALRGVKIYIILYMEPKIALNNDSEFVQNYLQQMNKNIKVLRHPNFILIPFLWSHHEKIIVIDQRVAFLGGLDLCYGRWDTQQHKLVQQHHKQEKEELWKGADFCNFRISDIYTPRKFQVSNIDKKSQPRMPWHDISLKIEGGSVHDLARHFIQYWNFVNFQTKLDDKDLLMHSGIHSVYKHPPPVLVSKESKEMKRHLYESFSRFLGTIKEVVRPTGKIKKANELSQVMVQKMQQLSQDSRRQSDFSNRLSIPSMRQDSVNLQLQQPIIQNAQTIRSNSYAELTEGQRQYYEHYLQEREKKYLPTIELPKINDLKHYSKKIEKKLKDIFVEGKFTDSSYNKENNIFNHEKRLVFSHQQKQYTYNKGQYAHQILRSASTWSLGLQESMPECSIYNAYLDMIRNSKYYVYIENQFFISDQNKICAVLIERINKAYREKQKFKVIIMMPLLPGFEGDITNQTSSSVMRVQLYWEYRTLNRGKGSLYQKLSHIQNIDDYLKVYSLRGHGITSLGVPVTQQVYIHSKLMIVDDQKVVIGSANINDRSLMGDRDSQIGIIVEDQQMNKDSQGRMYSETVRKLRVDLYMEHFGFTKQVCEDYHDEVLWKQIRINAKNNTEIYRTIFGCYPDDEMKTINDVKEMAVDEPSKQVYLQQSKHIKGHVVEFPLRFLEKENLNLKINQREYFIPYINFT